MLCKMLLIFIISTAYAIEMTSMYMKRSEVNDQKMSGSGYSYDAANGKPQEYSFEVDGTDNVAMKIIKDLGYDPFPDNTESLGTFPVSFDDYFPSAAKIPESASSTTQSSKFVPVPYGQSTTTKSPTTKSSVFNSNTYQSAKNAPWYPPLSVFRKQGAFPKYPYAPGFKNSSNKSYNDYGSAQRGEAFDKGYNVIDAYSKGLKGKYDNEYGKTYYDQGAVGKAAAFNNGGNFNVNQVEGKLAQSGSFGEKDYHNKGSKTTGFHNVYHKDDYDKQHQFYDRADRRGKFNRSGDVQSNDDRTAGGYVDGGYHADGKNSNKWANSDTKDNSKFDNYAKGFRKAQGNEGFHQHYQEYDNTAQKS